MEKTLSRGEKLGYGVADVGASLTFVAVNTWLLYFLINIVRLEPLLAGIIFVLGRVLDAVLDPFMGVLSDRLKSRLGRKVFIRWGAVPLGISFALLWLVPDGGQALKFGLALLFFCLFSVLYTVVQVPYMALTPDIARSYDERTSLTSFRMGFGTLASMLAFALPPFIILAFSQSNALASSSPLGWLMMGVVFGLVTVVAYFIMVLTVKEPSNGAVPPKQRGSFLSEYRSAFSIYGFKEIFSLFVVLTVGIMVLNSILPFYLESGLLIQAEAQPLVLGTLFGVAILSFPLWNFVAGRFGKRSSLIAGLVILSSSVLLLTLFSPAGRVSAFLLLMSACAGVGFSAVMLFPWAMLPDVVEFDELEHRQRREGLVYALFTFGQKLAGSIGVFSNAIVAAVFGYQQGVVAQSTTTVTALQMMAGPVSAGIFLLAIVFVLRFPITKQQHQKAQDKLFSNSQKE